VKIDLSKLLALKVAEAGSAKVGVFEPPPPVRATKPESDAI